MEPRLIWDVRLQTVLYRGWLCQQQLRRVRHSQMCPTPGGAHVFEARESDPEPQCTIMHACRGVLYLMRFSVERAAAQAGVNVNGMFLKSNSDDLRFLTGLIEANKVKAVRRGRGGGS